MHEFDPIVRQKELEIASQYIIDFIKKWCTPHDIVVISQTNVQLFCGETGFELREKN